MQYKLVGINDIINGPYSHCPEYHNLRIGYASTAESIAQYRTTTFLVASDKGLPFDFQPLIPNNTPNGKWLYVYLKEPFSVALRDELRALLHTGTLVEKDAVWAVVEAHNVAADLRAEMVTLSLPPQAKDHPEYETIFKDLTDGEELGDREPVMFVQYTEEYMREFLPRGCKIIDFMYAL